MVLGMKRRGQKVRKPDRKLLPEPEDGRVAGTKTEEGASDVDEYKILNG